MTSRLARARHVRYAELGHTTWICGHICSAETVLEDCDITQVHIPIEIQVHADLRIPTSCYSRPAQAVPEPDEVIEGDVAIAINVSCGGWRTTGGVDGGAGNGKSTSVTQVTNPVAVGINRSAILTGGARVQTIHDSVGIEVSFVGKLAIARIGIILKD